MYKKSGVGRRGIAENLGVSLSCIDKIMQGRNKVGFSKLMLMLQAMHIRPSAFFRLYEKELKKMVEWTEANRQFTINLITNTDFSDEKIAMLVGVDAAWVKKIRQELDKA